jgi:hypothetical protein
MDGGAGKLTMALVGVGIILWEIALFIVGNAIKKL